MAGQNKSRLQTHKNNHVAGEIWRRAARRKSAKIRDKLTPPCNVQSNDGAEMVTVATEDPLQLNCVPIQGSINGQVLLGKLRASCKVVQTSDATATSCKFPVP